MSLLACDVNCVNFFFFMHAIIPSLQFRRFTDIVEYNNFICLFFSPRYLCDRLLSITTFRRERWNATREIAHSLGTHLVVFVSLIWHCICNKHSGTTYRFRPVLRFTHDSFLHPRISIHRSISLNASGSILYHFSDAYIWYIKWSMGNILTRAIL